MKTLPRNRPSSWIAGLFASLTVLPGLAGAEDGPPPGTVTPAPRILRSVVLPDPSAAVRDWAIVKLNPAVVSDGMEVVDAEGRPVPTRVGDDGAPEVMIHAGSLTFLKVNRTRPLTLSDRDEFVLDGGVFVPITGAGTTAIEAVVWCKPYVRPNPAVVSWDPVGKRYMTVAQVGLRSADDARPTFAFPGPVEVSLEFVDIEPAPPMEGPPGPVRLESAGVGGERRVPLAFVAAGGEPRLRVRGDFGEQVAALALVPLLRVVPAEQAVPGLGLGDFALALRHVIPGRSRDFEFTLPEGLPEPVLTVVEGDLDLPAGIRPQDGTFRARSSGLGTVTVRISAGGAAADARIRQLFPWLVVLLAIGGGAAGGYARRFRRSTGRKSKSDARRVVEGMVVGFVVFAAAGFGVRLIPALPAEIAGSGLGAFLLGFFGGYFGVMVLEAMRPSRTAPAA